MMGKNVLVFIEIRGGKVKKPSLEAVSEGHRLAKTLGGEAHAIIVGGNLSDPASSLGTYGAQKVYTVENDSLNLYSPEVYAQAVSEAAKKGEAGAILIAATAMGKDLGPTVAAMLDTGIASDCTALEVEEGNILATRPVYAGRQFITVRLKGAQGVYTLRPNLFAAEELGGEASLEELSFDQKPLSVVKEEISTTQGKVELTEASIIVSGGRGLKGPEHLELRNKLAEVLGGAVGASRAIVDLGWCPHSEQVGQTGKTVSPNLYIAIAISGAIQHQAGMRTSKVIVAINKDPDAPIFKFATYGIVGDAFEVIPALTEQLQKAVAH
jgi:electron transfer flavoprotein alpha subunit